MPVFFTQTSTLINNGGSSYKVGDILTSADGGKLSVDAVDGNGGVAAASFLTTSYASQPDTTSTPYNLNLRMEGQVTGAHTIAQIEGGRVELLGADFMSVNQSGQLVVSYRSNAAQDTTEYDAYYYGGTRSFAIIESGVVAATFQGYLYAETPEQFADIVFARTATSVVAFRKTNGVWSQAETIFTAPVGGGVNTVIVTTSSVLGVCVDTKEANGNKTINVVHWHAGTSAWNVVYSQGTLLSPKYSGSYLMAYVGGAWRLLTGTTFTTEIPISTYTSWSLYNDKLVAVYNNQDIGGYTDTCYMNTTPASNPGSSITTYILRENGIDADGRTKGYLRHGYAIFLVPTTTYEYVGPPGIKKYNYRMVQASTSSSTTVIAPPSTDEIGFGWKAVYLGTGSYYVSAPFENTAPTPADAFTTSQWRIGKVQLKYPGRYLRSMEISFSGGNASVPANNVTVSTTNRHGGFDSYGASEIFVSTTDGGDGYTTGDVTVNTVAATSIF